MCKPRVSSHRFDPTARGRRKATTAHASLRAAPSDGTGSGAVPYQAEVSSAVGAGDCLRLRAVFRLGSAWATEETCAGLDLPDECIAESRGCRPGLPDAHDRLCLTAD